MTRVVTMRGDAVENLRSPYVLVVRGEADQASQAD
jgi:hypothetical protein